MPRVGSCFGFQERFKSIERAMLLESQSRSLEYFVLFISNWVSSKCSTDQARQARAIFLPKNRKMCQNNALNGL